MKADTPAAGVRLTDEQRIDWLRLIRSDNIGPRGLRAHLHQINLINGIRQSY